jgi:hypothetical protein
VPTSGFAPTSGRLAGSCFSAAKVSLALTWSFRFKGPFTQHRFASLRIVLGPVTIWGRCYDYNFLRFSPIFFEKIGVFLQNKCCDQKFS